MSYNFDIPVKRDNLGNMKFISSKRGPSSRRTFNFVGAEFDFPTAPSIIEGTKKLAENGLFAYTIQDSQYLNAVKFWMLSERNVKIDDDWLVPALGTIHSVATLIRLVTKVNEGVIISSPIYSRYAQAAVRLQRKVIDNPLVVRNGTYQFKFTHLEKLFADPSNKLFILCNPQNPIGQIWNTRDLQKISRLSNKYGVYVFSDEIFAETVYTNQKTPFYLDMPESEKYGIVSNSLGKSFGLTGLNHANLFIRNPKLRQKFILQRNADHYGSIDPLAYTAVICGYTQSGQHWLQAMNQYVNENIQLVREFLHRHFPKVTIYGGQGGYFLWLDWSAYFSTEKALEDFLLQKAYIELDFGSHYGKDFCCFTRMNLSSPRSYISDALTALYTAKSCHVVS